MIQTLAPSGAFYCPQLVTAKPLREQQMKYKLDSLEGLSDEQKALYEEKDGAFYLKVEGLPEYDTSELDGLKRKLKNYLVKRKQPNRNNVKLKKKRRKKLKKQHVKKVTLQQLRLHGKPNLSRKNKARRGKQSTARPSLQTNCRANSTNISK